MDCKQLIKIIVDELQRVKDQEFLITIYLFIQKFNSRDDN